MIMMHRQALSRFPEPKVYFEVFLESLKEICIYHIGLWCIRKRQPKDKESMNGRTKNMFVK